MRRLESYGWRLTVLPVTTTGLISPSDLALALREDTVLVSIMAASNETGVIQPISELAAIVKEGAPTALFHTDATQMVGKCPMSLSTEFENVDLLSLSAHKFHGPKGCGALFIRDSIDFPAMLLGGGQENDRRSGTTNVAGVVGLGAAATLAGENMGTTPRMQHLRDYFEDRLRERRPDVIIHGIESPRLPNTSSFSMPGHNASSLADELACQRIYVGRGSACSSGSPHPPRTLLEMGVEYTIAAAALRVSLSRYTQREELDCLLSKLTVARHSDT
jgi:cysteine desulfurase